ncbi:hypothetical protein ACFQY0_17535 [Haloferula chungangensis]|uniref:Lipoprotein n=1 Tax=Haloferula chungangensis TaxID=1048331 RepID=A0ABW2L9A1_9BACT
MRYLLFLPLIFAFSACTTPTSQSHVLEQAKAEVSKRESWGDQAYIRIDRRPDPEYMYWRDYTWKVSAGAVDYSDYPSYNGTRVIPGTEREMKFSRSGCLVSYKHATNECAVNYSAPQPVAPAPEPDK